MRPLGESFSGWRLPAGYVCERLSAYSPMPLVTNLLRRLAHSERLADWTISINLRDSRAFIGQKD